MQFPGQVVSNQSPSIPLVAKPEEVNNQSQQPTLQTHEARNCNTSGTTSLLHPVLSSASIASMMSDYSTRVNISHTPSISSLASELTDIPFDAHTASGNPSSMRVRMDSPPVISSLASDLSELSTSVSPPPSSSPESSKSSDAVKLCVIRTPEEIEQQKEKVMQERIKRQQSKDPYVEPGSLDRYINFINTKSIVYYSNNFLGMIVNDIEQAKKNKPVNC